MAAPVYVFEILTSDCDSPSSAAAWSVSVPLSLKTASISDTLLFSVAWLLSAGQSLKKA